MNKNVAENMPWSILFRCVFSIEESISQNKKAAGSKTARNAPRKICPEERTL